MVKKIILLLLLTPTICSADLFGATGKIAGGIANKLIGNAVTNKAVEEDIVKMVNATKSGYPAMIDSDTRAESIVAGPGLRYAYYFTLVNMPTASRGRPEFASAISNQVKSYFCANKGAKYYLDKAW